MYRSKEVFAPRFGYFGEQRGRFWVEQHVPINNSPEVQSSFYAQNQSPFYAEKHIYDSNLSQSGAYLTPPPLMRVTTNVQEVQRQQITCQQQGPTYNYKNSDDEIRQLDFERQRAMNEFKSKRDAEHKARFEEEQQRISQKIRDEVDRAEAQALEIARKKGLRIKVF